MGLLNPYLTYMNVNIFDYNNNNNNNNLLRYLHNNTWHYLFKNKSYFVEEISCLSNIAWKTKAAVDLYTKGSMLLKRNKTFALISYSLKRLYSSVISLKNFKRKLSYNWHEKRKCIAFSTSFEWQKEQILKLIGVFGIVCLPFSRRNL